MLLNGAHRSGAKSIFLHWCKLISVPTKLYKCKAVKHRPENHFVCVRWIHQLFSRWPWICPDRAFLGLSGTIYHKEHRIVFSSAEITQGELVLNDLKIRGNRTASHRQLQVQCPLVCAFCKLQLHKHLSLVALWFQRYISLQIPLENIILLVSGGKRLCKLQLEHPVLLSSSIS